MEPLLEMRDISKFFGGLCAVSRVNFSSGKERWSALSATTRQENPPS